MIIFIDGWCPNCKRFGKIINKIDFWGHIEIYDIRKSNYIKQNIDIEKAKKLMCSIDSNNKVSYGFNSIFNIFKSLRILWIFIPLLFLLKISKIGDYLYNELAVRRGIIPIVCIEETCSI